ncbi:PKD domain-containing protein [Pendulispora rubella]|uniref:PKD domain-containing protein n=1 Tax=Pendulispora rubella TaxID=2741070 RepID=A0ABZ2KXF4_9BACT
MSAFYYHRAPPSAVLSLGLRLISLNIGQVVAEEVDMTDHVRSSPLLAVLLPLALLACSSDEASNSSPGVTTVAPHLDHGPSPRFEIVMNSPSPRANERVQLTVSNVAGMPPISARWNFGDGQTGVGVTTEHQWAVASPTPYLVSVTATTSDGQQGTTSKAVTVQSE